MISMNSAAWPKNYGSQEFWQLAAIENEGFWGGNVAGRSLNILQLFHRLPPWEVRSETLPVWDAACRNEPGFWLEYFNRAWYAWFTWFKKNCAMTLHGLLNSISASWLQKLWHACKRYIEIDLGCVGQAAIDRFSVFWPSRSLPQGKACWR